MPLKLGNISKKFRCFFFIKWGKMSPVYNKLETLLNNLN